MAFAIEYLWLGFAALGLFTAIAQSRTYFSAGRESFEEDTYIAWAAALKADATSAVDFFSKYQYQQWTLHRDEIPAHIAFIAWARRLTRTVPDSAVSGSVDSLAVLAREPLGNQPAVVGDYKRSLLAELRSLLGVARRIASLKQEARSTQVEDALRLLSPWLLALALALRITKATGDARGLFARRARLTGSAQVRAVADGDAEPHASSTAETDPGPSAAVSEISPATDDSRPAGSEENNHGS